MAKTTQSGMDVDAFLAWSAEQPGRYELERGTVVAMSPEAVGPRRATDGTREALAAAVRTAGLDCGILPDRATVAVDGQTAYMPDALVRCSTPLDTGSRMVSDPIVAAEVVPPGPEAGSRGGRLVEYLSLPSLQHYLIVDAERRVLVHHARRGDEIATRILRGGPLRLDPPGLDLLIEDLFGGPPEA